tara:strand:- start:17452 stop:17862 length:411 start_codon:yes stop_codon:yes gene_type:complete
MSTYCKLTEHNKDNKRVYRRCSITDDKSLDSDRCVFDKKKKHCYTRKKTTKKQPGKKISRKRVSVPATAAQPPKLLIPIDYRNNIDLNMVKKYKELSKQAPISENMKIDELHSKLKNNYFKSKSLGTFWLDFYINK